MKYDLHVHSMCSHDSDCKPQDIIKKAIRMGLDGIVITEHNSFEASAPWTNINNCGITILRGMEYKSREGHILIYGVDSDKYLPFKGKPLVEVINLAETLNWGLVAPHPFKGGEDSLGSALHKYWIHFHGIEFNSRCSDEQNKAAIDFARKHQLSMTGGSDAHFSSRIGRVYTIFPSRINNIQELVESLKQGNFSYGISLKQ